MQYVTRIDNHDQALQFPSGQRRISVPLNSVTALLTLVSCSNSHLCTACFVPKGRHAYLVSTCWIYDDLVAWVALRPFLFILEHEQTMSCVLFWGEKKTPAFVTSFTKCRVRPSFHFNYLCVGSQFYTHNMAIFVGSCINNIKTWDLKWLRKKLKGSLRCGKLKLTLNCSLMHQPEFAWLQSFIMPWPLCKCHGATVLQWLWCTVLLCCVSLHLFCFELCDQVTVVEGQHCAYATLPLAQLSSWTYLSQGGRQTILISIETKNCFPEYLKLLQAR